MDNGELSEPVNRALARLSAGNIENLAIDVAHNRITVVVSSLWSTGLERHTVVFEGVASLYVVLGAQERRFTPLRQDRFPGDTLIGEVDDAFHFSESIGHVRFDATPGTVVSRWAGEFTTRPNFLLTSGDAIFLFEARQVYFDDMVFDVGYVHDDSQAAQ